MDANEWVQRRQVTVYALAVLLAVVAASTQPGAAVRLRAAVEPVLAVLLYVTFLEIPFVRFRRAFGNTRFVAAALATNFLVVPIVVWVLTRPLPQDPALLVAVLLVLLTPCIDYVVVFTGLAGGDAEQLIATTPVLLVAQLLALPGYLWLFLGVRVAAVVDVRPFVEAFLALVALPLLAAWATEWWAERSSAWRRWQTAAGWLPVPMLALTLFAVVASYLPRVRGALDRLVAVVPVYVAFLAVMTFLAVAVAKRVGLDTGEGRALAFTSVTRNSLVVLPLALALPAGYAIAPAVVVTQTLVELPGMVVLTRVVPRLLPGDADAGRGGTDGR